jgi:hypothetical protein
VGPRGGSADPGAVPGRSRVVCAMGGCHAASRDDGYAWHEPLVLGKNAAGGGPHCLLAVMQRHQADAALVLEADWYGCQNRKRTR